MRRPTVADFDHPIVFLFFLSLALIGLLGLLGAGLGKFGIASPVSFLAPSQG